jgi:hypothetical protein
MKWEGLKRSSTEYGLAETLRVNNLLIPTSKFTYGAKNSQIFKIGGGWMNQP